MYVVDRNLKLVTDSDSCFNTFITPSILLVDNKNDLRGVYDLSIKGIDRAMVEIDILLTLQDESGNKW